MARRDRPKSLGELNDERCGDLEGCPHWDYEEPYPHLDDDTIRRQRERQRRYKRQHARWLPQEAPHA